MMMKKKTILRVALLVGVAAIAQPSSANVIIPPPVTVAVCIFTDMPSATAFQARIDTALGWPSTDGLTTHETSIVPDGPDGPTLGVGVAVILTPLAETLLEAGDPAPVALPGNWGADVALSLP